VLVSRRQRRRITDRVAQPPLPSPFRLSSESLCLLARPHHTHTVLIHPPGSPSTRLNPHSPARNVGCTTSHDFVPWRFSDACPKCVWMGRYPGVRETLYGAFLVKGVPPRVLSIFLSLSFFVRPGQPVSSSRPYGLMTPAARRSGQGWRVSATEGSSLRAPSMTAHLTRVGDDDIEGSPRVVHDCSCHILVCGGYRDPDHDAVMRIGSKLRGGGPILTHGMRAMESAGAPPPRTVIGDLSQTVPTGSETFRPS